MSELITWSNEEIEELFNLVVKLFNGCTTRNKLIDKIQKRTGVRSNFYHSDSSCNTGNQSSTGIRNFSQSSEDKVGNLIDRYLNKKFIIMLLPMAIKKAFFAFSSLKKTFIRKPNNGRKENELDIIEYSLMITVFTESMVYYSVNKIMNEVKNNYSSSTNDISRWASPYIIKDLVQKIDNQILYEFNEYGISMKSTWLGEDVRNNVNRRIVKMDYQGLFTNNLGAKSNFGTNFRYITLEGHEIQDEMLFYFETIEHLPNELNAKLGRNLNSLSKSIYILSIEPEKTAFILDRKSESFIPGSKIGIIYFPCKDKISINCQSAKTKKSVELELSDDKLVILDLNKNKYTFRNTDSGIVTYCILTYIFGPK
ncbi:uncharacterized protein cubi_03500 [Cryptosporidium ubiquitum]|uniref:Uncharacterized protein n=1 Tax=Cryptosporidium ubiquitum TaxID=857276 RepID=A0A1J4MHJ3_9CRYT|nr:uncharacterized protein cubi_03500 [Cryptosporidium ubiquitum]OII73702.1 hypothetical protein cubi_03500 [Cryptosporidium ubiquitum]